MWKPKSVIVYSHLAPQIVEDLKERWPHIEFHSCPKEENLRERITKADALLAFRVPSDLNLDNIRWIHSLGAGVDALLRHPALPDDLIMTRTIGEMPRAMAEYCLAHILADCQNFEIYRRQEKEQSWTQHTPKKIAEKEVLILGIGGMGCGIAELLSNVGCRVWGVSRSGEQKKPFFGVKPMDGYQKLAPKINVVISTLPITPDTRGLIDVEFLSKFHQIHLINVGRGGVMELDALRKALDEGHVRTATLDVFPQEPLEPSHWLWEDPRVRITPHISALTTTDSVLAELVPVLESLNNGKRDFPTVDFQRGY